MVSWPPSSAPMAHGEPGSPGPGAQRVVGPLAELAADRVDRRQVDHVEAHGRGRLEALVRGVEGAGDPGLVLLVPLRTLGPGEELVPGGEQRRPPVDVDRVVRGGGDQLARSVAVPMASRTSSASTTSSRSSTCWPESRLLAAPRSRAAVWVSPAAVARSAEAVNSVLPSVQTSSTSIPAGILISALCTQVSHGSLQPSTRKVHDPSRVQGDRGRPPVEAGRGGPVHAEHRLLPLRVRQHDRRVDRVVALPEDLGPDRDGLTDRGLGRVGAALDHRGHLHHRDPVDQGAERAVG